MNAWISLTSLARVGAGVKAFGEPSALMIIEKKKNITTALTHGKNRSKTVPASVQPLE